MTAHPGAGAKGTVSNEPVLEFRDAGFAYGGQQAVEHVSLRLAQGEFLAIVGPNGSGKSTLIKLALGLLRPQAGRVMLFGRSPERFRRWEQVGYVPQVTPGVHGNFPATVAETVAHGLYRGVSLRSFWRRSASPRVLETLDAVGVAHLRDRRIGALSVGQQQRVLLARALVGAPQLLVLDEPAAGVDVGGEEQLFSLLRRLNREQGIAIVLVSHDIGAVVREATTVACLDRSLVFHGPSHELTHEELYRLYGTGVDVLLHDALHEHR